MKYFKLILVSFFASYFISLRLPVYANSFPDQPMVKKLLELPLEQLQKIMVVTATGSKQPMIMEVLKFNRLLKFKVTLCATPSNPWLFNRRGVPTHVLGPRVCRPKTCVGTPHSITMVVPTPVLGLRIQQPWSSQNVCWDSALHQRGVTLIADRYIKIPTLIDVCPVL